MFAGRLAIAGALIVACCVVQAQTPRPFPQPVRPPSPGSQPANPPPTTTAPFSKPAPAADVPTAETLGVPIYPNAQYITSYDAGRGQRFYLFGVAVPFADLIAYYRKVLKQNGSELFLTPPTHVFEIGRYREETMAFPPSVTIKDYTWAGSAGYPNPKRGAEPERFATVIQIVPSPPGTPQ